MARKTKKVIKKMYTQKEALEADVLHMTKEELRPVISSLARIVNKQITTLEKKDKHNVSLRMIEKSGGRISPWDANNNPKNKRQLLVEYRRAKAFLESELHTLEGVKNFREQARKRLSDRLNVNLSVNQGKALYDIYNKLDMHFHYEINEYNDKYKEIQKEIAVILKNDLPKIDTSKEDNRDRAFDYVLQKLRDKGILFDPKKAGAEYDNIDYSDTSRQYERVLGTHTKDNRAKNRETQ